MRRALTGPAFAKHCAPAVAFDSPELPTALFRVLAREAFSAEDFARFFNLLAADWTAGARRVVLSKVTRGLVRGEMLVPGCECGCQPPRLKDTLFEKMAALATLGVTHGLAEETRLLPTAAATPSPSRENDDPSAAEPFFDGLCSPAPAKRAPGESSARGDAHAAAGGAHAPARDAVLGRGGVSAFRSPRFPETGSRDGTRSATTRRDATAFRSRIKKKNVFRSFFF